MEKKALLRHGATDDDIDSVIGVTDAKVEKLEIVNLIDCISQSMSKDNQHVLLVFRVGDPADESTHRNFGITLPATQARWLMGVGFAATAMVEKAGKNPGNSVMHFPMLYSVGHAPELDAAEFTLPDGTKFAAGKGKTVIGFDAGRPSEINFVLMNAPMMALAEAIRVSVAPRLTEEDKAELKAAKVPV